MKKNFVIPLLMLFSQTLGKKEMRQTKVFYDENGKMMRAETEISAATQECYQYTWFGRVTDKTNSTQSCLDVLVDDDEIERPCWPPLVWTTSENGGNELNRPDPQDVVEACRQQNPPCNPFCKPSGGETCIKYTLRTDSDGAVVRESSFCGRINYNEKTANSYDDCWIEYGVGGFDVEVCMCDSKNLCNVAAKLRLPGLITALLYLLFVHQF